MTDYFRSQAQSVFGSFLPHHERADDKAGGQDKRRDRSSPQQGCQSSWVTSRPEALCSLNPTRRVSPSTQRLGIWISRDRRSESGKIMAGG